MIIEIKDSKLTEGQVNSVRELLVDYFQIDFQVELESNTIRFKNN